MNTAMRVGIALGGAAVVIAGGSAFTASNTVPNSEAGYGTSTVSGENPTNITHTLNATGDKIMTTVLTFADSQEDNTVAAAFGSANLTTCTTETGTEYKVATCDWDTGVTTSTATAFNVAVSSK